MSLSSCVVYTIDFDGYVIDQFECDREIAMTEYHNRRTVKGSYLIANKSDDIPNKWRRKPLVDLKRATQHSENQ